MRRAATALVAGAVVLLLVPGPGPQAAPSRGGAYELARPRVTLIADSVGGVLFWVVPQRERLAQNLDFRLEVKTCRKLVSTGCYAYGEVPSSALDVVATLGSELGQVVVVDVGYNDFAESYAAGIDAVMNALTAAGVQRVIWVTLRESQSTWAEINSEIRVAPARWPQLVVADWAPVAEREPSWFVDEAHMNDVGAEGFVDFLRPVILAACGKACAPAEATVTIAEVIVRSGRLTLRWHGNSVARSYDVAVRRSGGAWRILATRLEGTTYRVRGVAGTRMQARVRARDETDAPGAWSPPRSFRF